MQTVHALSDWTFKLVPYGRFLSFMTRFEAAHAQRLVTIGLSKKSKQRFPCMFNRYVGAERSDWILKTQFPAARIGLSMH